MAGRRQLKIAIQRDINTYLYGALPLCAILPHQQLHPWYYEHYVQLYATLHPSGDETPYLDYIDTFAYHEVADCEIMGLEATSKIDSIIQFLKGMIDSGYYTTVFVDDAFLRGLSPSWVHEFMVFGYDDDSRSLDVLGYDNRWHSFGKLSFSYDSFAEAFNRSVTTVAESNQSDYMSSLIQTLSPKLEATTFSHSRLGDQIAAYATSEPSKFNAHPWQWWWIKADANPGAGVPVPLTPNMNEMFGLGVYDAVLIYIDSILNRRIRDRDTVDYRLFHMLVEHKHALIKRLALMTESDRNAWPNEFFDSYRNVLRRLNILRVGVRRNAGISPVEAPFGPELDTVLITGRKTIQQVQRVEREMLSRIVENLPRGNCD